MTATRTMLRIQICAIQPTANDSALARSGAANSQIPHATINMNARVPRGDHVRIRCIPISTGFSVR